MDYTKRFLLGLFAFGVCAGSAPIFAAGESRISMPSYKPSPINFGLDLQFSQANYTRYQPIPGAGMPGANLGGHVGLEWITPFPWGELGIGMGITGGVATNNVVGTARDGSQIFATVYAFPVDISLSYRLDYFEDQPVVPYGRIGTSATFINQTSKTGADRPGYYGGLGLDWAAGLEISMYLFDRASQRNFDTDFGVNHTYLILEYVSSRSLLGPNYPDFSRQEMRIGLRFEI